MLKAPLRKRFHISGFVLSERAILQRNKHRQIINGLIDVAKIYNYNINSLLCNEWSLILILVIYLYIILRQAGWVTCGVLERLD